MRSACAFAAPLVLLSLGVQEVRAQPGLDYMGLHGGAIVRRADNTEALLGGQVGLRIADNVEAVVSFSLRSDFPDDPTHAWDGRAFWTYATLRAVPLSMLDFLTVGIGLAVGRASAQNDTRGLDASKTELHEVLALGLHGRVGRLRPFADLHLTGWVRSPTRADSHVTLGAGWLFERR